MQKYDQLILGKNQVYSAKNTGLNNNCLVVGGTGCGKTMSVVEPGLLYSESSQVVTLSKRVLVDRYSEYFREKGFCVMDLNLAHPEKSEYIFEPLKYVDSYESIRLLSESIVLADPNQADNKHIDPFWNHTAISLLAACISYKIMTKDNPSMKDVIRMIQDIQITESGNGIKTAVDNQFDRIRRRDKYHFCIRNWDAFRANPAKTAACVLTTLLSALNDMFTEEFCNAIEEGECVDFNKLANEKTILFITTSSTNPSTNVIANIFYSQMFDKLAEIAEENDGTLKESVRIWCDDFAACGSKIARFPELISIFRAQGISCVLNVQSESQLESLYSETESNTIIDNCDTYLYMGGNSLKTATNMSKRLNLPLEDVLYMPLGQVAICRRGQRPVITERYNTLEDEKYLELLRKENMKKTGQREK